MAKGKLFYKIHAKSILFAMEKTKNTPAFFLYPRSEKKKKKSFTRFEKESQQRGQHKLFPRINDKGKKTLTRFS
jgi:hypothetical protein